MSNSGKLFNEIHDQLHYYSSLIQQKNKLNLTDEANFAEDIFGKILSIVFNKTFKNANVGRANASTIDLADGDTCIQVTSNQQFKVKKQKTLLGFSKVTFKKYSHIKIVFITTKEVSNTILKYHKFKSQDYEGYDIIKLLTLIKQETKPLQKKEILEILNEELEKIEEIPVFDKKELDKLKKTQPINRNYGLIIDRKSTVDALFNKAKANHSLVIGQPGIGKTFTLTEFNTYCWNNGTPAVTIKVNELITGEENEINDLLKAKNWLPYLKALKKGKHQFLIFDAFDTAKDETLKNNILLLIKRAMTHLPQSWHIIVSARTYDATKSPKLLQLFSQGHHSVNSKSTPFEIKPLLDEQVKHSLSQFIQAKRIYAGCSDKLKSVLTIPYFLKIFEEVIKADKINSPELLKAINTEEELLNVYWNEKIGKSENKFELEKFLMVLTQSLYELENLNIERSVVFSKIDVKILPELIGDGIIMETGINGGSIAFTHNILFDYAISRLVIKTASDDYIKQIDENNKRPFIYRPSYVYLLKRIWQENRSHFWQLYNKVFSLNDNVFKITHQILFNSVVSVSYTSNDDLRPILNQTNTTNYELLIRKLLDCIKFTIEPIRQAEAHLISELTQHIKPGYIWHLGYFINRLSQSPNTEKMAAKAAANYLNYVLEERTKNTESRSFLDNNAIQWGIPNITRAFKFHQKEVTELINKVLGILQEDEFPIGYFSQLSQNINFISQVSPRFAATIFKAIYLKVENRDTETFFGSGVLFGFRSNRRQDFNMCYHRLEEYYPEFILSAPDVAIKLALELTNILKLKPYANKAKAIKIQIQGKTFNFVPDHHISDWDHEYKEGIGKIITSLYDFLDSKIAKEEDVETSINTVISNNKGAFSWKCLMKFLTKYPSKFSKNAFDLLQNETILTSLETGFEAGELIKAIVPFLSAKESKTLEKFVLNLTYINYRYDASMIEKDITQLLSCFPSKKISYKKSRTLLAKYPKIKNTPHFSSSSFSDDSRRYDFIKDNDIDIDIIENNVAYSLTEEIRAEIEKYGHKEMLTVKDTSHFFNRLMYLHVNSLKDGVHSKLKRECDEVLCKGIKVLSRNRKHLSANRLNKCFNICNEMLTNEALKPTSFDKGDAHRGINGFSPSARIYASEALVNLSNCNSILTIGSTIKTLLNDNSVIVRVNAAICLLYFYRNDPTFFWAILKNQFEIENDDHVLSRLLGNVQYTIIKNEPNEVDKLMAHILPIVIEKRQGSNSLQHYASVLVASIVANNSSVAKEIISKNHLKGDFIEEICLDFIHRVQQESVDRPLPTYAKTYFTDELCAIITAQVEALKLTSLTPEAAKPFFHILDKIVERIHYSLLQKNVSAHSDVSIQW